MGVHLTYGGDFFGVNDYNNDLSKLSQNYPNPFSATTTIDYTLVNSSNVSVEVFDITGKSVKSISEGYKSAGSHQVSLDATNLNNGIYYYSFKTDAGQITKKMVVKH
jgi:flagellar hook assembly protein FlgD